MTSLTQIRIELYRRMNRDADKTMCKRVIKSLEEREGWVEASEDWKKERDHANNEHKPI